MADRFELFGTSHIVVMLLTLGLCVGLPLLVRKVPNKKLENSIAWGFAIILVGAEFVNMAYTYYTVGIEEVLTRTLPLHISGMSPYLAAIALVTRKQLVYEVVYYWVLIAMLQAVITPAITEPFPTFRFMKFFINHSGAVVAIVYLTWGLQMRPQWGNIPKAFGVTVGFTAFVGVMNLVLDANYMFLRAAPPGANPLFFLAWPWYIAFMIPVYLVFMLIFYSIHPLTDRVRGKGRSEQPPQEE